MPHLQDSWAVTNGILHGKLVAERVAAGGPRIEGGAGDPDAAKGIEGEVEGFLDFGFVGDELDFETGREFEKGFRLGGR